MTYNILIDKIIAMQKALEWGDKIPLGILYKEEKPAFHDKIPYLKEGPALVDRPHDPAKIKKFMYDFV